MRLVGWQAVTYARARGLRVNVISPLRRAVEFPEEVIAREHPELVWIDEVPAGAPAAEVLAMLRRLEFSQGPGGLSVPPQGKCPVCLGWDGSKHGLGETRMRHREDCDLAAMIKRFSP